MDIQSLIGFVLPPLVDIIMKIDFPFLDTDYDEKARIVLSFLVCAVIGIVVNFQNLVPFNFGMLLSDVAMVFATAQITYRLYWKNSDAREALDRATR